MPKPPIVDRSFAEKFLRAVDRPLEYGVYQLFHEWWEDAPQSAIDAYADHLRGVAGAEEFLAERYLPAPLTLDQLADCAPGTLGDAYKRFIVDNDLAENLARDYRAFNEQLAASGKLDRLPEDLSYTIVRGFQIHDFIHVLIGQAPDPKGELAVAGFHFAQLQFPYHAMRVAVTTAHTAFVAPQVTLDAMDAIVEGWVLGRATPNLHFTRWEDEIHTPIADVRAKWSLPALAA